MIFFPPFRLDPDDKCLWKCTSTGAIHKLALAPRAFDMLEYLLRNAGRLVTHETLLAALWPNQWVQPEVIKTYVRSIRSVLDDDARQPKFIETHRGRGYRFVAAVGTPEPDPVVPTTTGGNMIDDPQRAGYSIDRWASPHARNFHAMHVHLTLIVTYEPGDAGIADYPDCIVH